MSLCTCVPVCMLCVRHESVTHVTMYLCVCVWGMSLCFVSLCACVSVCM